MKITRVAIERWRDFRNIVLDIGDANAVCLVGENGSGKTAILELIVAALASVGLASGYPSVRTQPFHEQDASFDITLRADAEEIAEFLSGPIDGHMKERLPRWDGRICVERKDGKVRHFAPDGQLDRQYASILANFVPMFGRPLVLYVDANRSYGQININDNTFVERLRRSERPDAQTLKDQASTSSENMYREWEIGAVGDYARLMLIYVQRAQEAAERQQPIPAPPDPYQAYRERLKEALPHLEFKRVKTDNPIGLFFTSGSAELRLCQLSGGEREVAFILGQLRRFGIRNGIVIVDEPELHLNPDLVRTWVSALKAGIGSGQLWIGTHSMEAVEVCGAEKAFVLMRSPETRLISESFRVADNEVYTTLSNALGTPGFSLQRLSFVYVEGDVKSRESQRFIELCPGIATVRFIDAGGSRDVERKLMTVQDLARSAGQALRVGGIIDRDFKTPQQVGSLVASGIHVLECHEIENVYLHPASLAELARRVNITKSPIDVIRDVSDEQAGPWILGAAFYALDYNGTLSRELRLKARQPWVAIDADRTSFSFSIAALTNAERVSRHIIVEELERACAEYATLRVREDLWQLCCGKEAVSAVASQLLSLSLDQLRSSLHVLWSDTPGLIPSPLAAIRTYVAAL